MVEALLEKAKKLPLLPGVYIMKDEAQEVIYVGKAKFLKHRVSSYFRGQHEGKTQVLVSKIVDFDVIVTATELECLVLESSLIKRHQPRYNILLKDDKGFPFVRLDVKSAYPVFTIASKKQEDGAKYFGPFGSRTITREAIDTMLKALKLPTCSRKFPRDIGRDRPCLNYHMGHCKGFCQEELPDNAAVYNRSVKEAAMILEGKTDDLVSELTQLMTDAAEDMLFEIAAEYRDRIKAIESLKTRQRVISGYTAEMDAVGFSRGAKCCFTVLHYDKGTLAEKDYELMDEPLEPDDEVLSSLIRQYYSIRGSWPKTLLIPFEVEDQEPLESFLSQAAGRKVSIEVPKRGERLRYVEAAVLNAGEEVRRATTSAQRRHKTLEWLQAALELPDIPKRIEAFDISNLGNTGIVGAMTVHLDGKPLKRDYRKFRIKELSSQDDYHSMQEVIRRRYKRYLDKDEKFSQLPDLLLIDGGQTHAKGAEDVLGELGLSLNVYGMVKDDRHRTRGLISSQGQEIGLSGNPAVFALIGRIQEETHRFAIEYQRSLRTASIGSSLDSIPGVGDKRRNELIKHFKTIKAIKEAGIDELSAVVPKNTAKAIYEHFHSPDGEKGEDETS